MAHKEQSLDCQIRAIRGTLSQLSSGYSENCNSTTHCTGQEDRSSLETQYFSLEKDYSRLMKLNTQLVGEVFQLKTEKSALLGQLDGAKRSQGELFRENSALESKQKTLEAANRTLQRELLNRPSQTDILKASLKLEKLEKLLQRSRTVPKRPLSRRRLAGKCVVRRRVKRVL